MKKISIIIPHFNGWNKLDELLNTIPVTDNIEVIVVDDKSDNVKKQLPQFMEKFPNVQFLQNDTDNKGAGVARNIALEVVTGKWLMFAGSDDKFTIDFTKEVRKYYDSKYDIIYFKPSSFIENTDAIGDRHRQYADFVSKYQKDPSQLNTLKLKYEFLVPWSRLIRHQIIKDNNIRFEEIMYSNDILFSAKAGYHANKITSDPTTIYEARENKGSLTSNMSEAKFRARFNAWIDYAVFLKEHLSTADYKLLDISALSLLAKVYEHSLSIKNYFYVLNKCFRYNIPVLDRRIKNPKIMLNLIKDKINKKVKNKEK